jgi:hypothetical protein
LINEIGNAGNPQMFESEVSADNSSNISIGRISFCVATALPVILLIRLWFDPGATKHERFGDFLLGILMYLFSLVLTGVGTIILVRAKVKKLPLLFWSIALFFASLPLLVGIIGSIVMAH